MHTEWARGIPGSAFGPFKIRNDLPKPHEWLIPGWKHSQRGRAPLAIPDRLVTQLSQSYYPVWMCLISVCPPDRCPPSPATAWTHWYCLLKSSEPPSDRNINAPTLTYLFQLIHMQCLCFQRFMSDFAGVRYSTILDNSMPKWCYQAHPPFTQANEEKPSLSLPSFPFPSQLRCAETVIYPYLMKSFWGKRYIFRRRLRSSCGLSFN